MKHLPHFILFLVTLSLMSFKDINTTAAGQDDGSDGFKYQTEQFADLKILRYRVPGFHKLSLDQKKLLYYLYKAGLSGRDIIYDQNYRHNLCVRRTLEAIVNNHQVKKVEPEWDNFMIYTKRVWFSNGIHHHYSTKKLEPEFSKDYFTQLVKAVPESALPLEKGETVDALLKKLDQVIFDPNYDTKRVNLDSGADHVLNSANNYYGPDVTQKEFEEFYEKMIDKDAKHPISYGLNSKLIKENGKLVEVTWSLNGMYGSAIKEIVMWLEKAIEFSETDQQQITLMKLVEYYRTGDLKRFDDYNIEWVKDTSASVDVINGFIESYGDAMGYRGSYESVVSFKDMEASKRINAISDEAQWFEDNSSIMDAHKKDSVKGISAKVITIVGEAGDATPASPIGINLPNSNWIRSEYGSKSVNIGNIVSAYDAASKDNGSLEEFAYNDEQIRLAKEHGGLAGNLHTDMHEVIGHASGRINDGIGTPKQTLKSYSSTLEEGRADLVALYYLMDQKMIDIGVMSTLDVGKTEYNSYIMNGMMLQLKRIEPGEQIEESHMRNRQMIARWAFEKGKKDNVIERKERDDKTYFVINDYEKLRGLFGELLREIQRIKSEGDFEAGKALVENYGVKVDKELHAEVLKRYEKLNIAPYSGFINPVLEPVEEGGQIVDVKVVYPNDFKQQMLYYAREYSFLPTYN